MAPWWNKASALRRLRRIFIFHTECLHGFAAGPDRPPDPDYPAAGLDDPDRRDGREGRAVADAMLETGQEAAGLGRHHQPCGVAGSARPGPRPHGVRFG